MAIGKLLTFTTTKASSLEQDINIERTDPSVIAQMEDELAVLKQIGTSNEFNVRKGFNESAEGVIHIMESETTDTTFIVKLTHPNLVDQYNQAPGEMLGSFKYTAEAKVLLGLKPHLNIMSMLAVAEHDAVDGSFEIWSEHCQGGDLFYQVDYWYQKRKTIVPEVFLLHLIVSLFDGLAFLHSGLRYDQKTGRYTQDEEHDKIVHGDLKMENLFLRWPTSRPSLGGMPEIVIGDFGTAKTAKNPNPMTDPGTFSLHAPEDVEVYGDAKYVEKNLWLFYEMARLRMASSDIWAAGQIVYMIAAKAKNPFPRKSDLTELSTSREYETPGLRHFIVRCLQSDPAKRGTADFSDRTGLVGYTQRLRTVRDELIAKTPLNDPLEWRVPRPVRR